MPAGAKIMLVGAALLGAAAVALGALGAHALKARLAPDMLAVWQTAVQYHFWHVLALLGCALAAWRLEGSTLIWVAGAAFGAGIVLFSGSLYALALGAPRALGMVTPLGGLAFIGGWLLLGLAAVRAS